MGNSNSGVAGKNLKWKDIEVHTARGGYDLSATVKGKQVCRYYVWQPKSKAMKKFYDFCNSL